MPVQEDANKSQQIFIGCLSSNHIRIFNNKPLNNPLIWNWYVLLSSLLEFGNDYITF